MAKKLTKAEIAKIKRLAKIAKNPTAAINSGKMKMKKQEVPLAGIGKAAARVIGKAIVNATTGKTAARKYAESSMRADAKRAAAKKSAKSVKEALKTAKKTKPLAEPKSNVKVLPRRTAPKSGLEGRGAKLNPRERKERAQDYRFEKGLKRRDSEEEIFYGGLKGPKEGTMRGPKAKNARKERAIVKESKRKLPIKINSKAKNKPPF